MTDHRQLQQELHQAGASAAEARALLPIAAQLRQLTSPDRPRLRLFKPILLGAASLAVGMFLVITAQAALPTSWLYPVQKFSDAAAISLYPQYRATVMMKRAEQVNQLVADNAGSTPVLATLADYTKEASAYKSTRRANYAAFEYCKTNLQQAASAASPAVRQAIASSLQSLETT